MSLISPWNLLLVSFNSENGHVWIHVGITPVMRLYDTSKLDKLPW
jgi:hypothetical protein